MDGWCFDMSKAPRGSYDVRAASRGSGHVKTFQRETIIAASACGVVTLSYYIPEEKRWSMFGAGESPIAWMVYDGRKALPAHPTMAESWFERRLREAA